MNGIPVDGSQTDATNIFVAFEYLEPAGAHCGGRYWTMYSSQAQFEEVRTKLESQENPKEKILLASADEEAVRQASLGTPMKTRLLVALDEASHPPAEGGELVIRIDLLAMGLQEALEVHVLEQELMQDS